MWLIKEYSIKKIVTSCAECYGVFQSQYPAVGEMNVEVLHSLEIMDQPIPFSLVELVEKAFKSYSLVEVVCSKKLLSQVLVEPQ